MIPTLLLSAALSATSLAAPSVPFPGGDGEADGVLVRYDLSGALATYDDAEVEESLLLCAGDQYSEIPRTPAAGLHGVADPDAIVELLTRLFLEEFEYEGRDIALQGDGQLLVLAPEDVQARVRGALQELETTLGAAVELQVDVLSLPGDGPAPFGGRSIVDAAQIGTLPTAGRQHEQYLVRLQPGRTSLIERMRRLPLIVNYDVEIAQGAVIHDPDVYEAEAGTRILLRGAPTAGGLGLTVFFAHGAPLQEEPTPIEAPLRSYVATDQEGAERYIEAPRLMERYEIAFRSAAFDTLLPPGKALVLTSTMDLAASGPEPAAKSREVVVIRRAGGELPRLRRYAAGGSRRELVFLNAESFRLPAAYVRGSVQNVGDDHRDKIPSLVATMRDEPSVFLVDWVDRRFSTWRLIGPWLVCVYDPAWDGDALTRLDALIAGWQETDRLLDVEVRAAARGAEVASWRLPVRAGSRVGAMVGISTTSLVDYDVEVAQSAAAADPQMRPQFAGLAFRARAMALASGGAVLELDVGLNHRRTPPRLVSLGGPLMTRLEKTAFEMLRIQERVAFTPDLDATSQTLGDRAGAANVTVSVR